MAKKSYKGQHVKQVKQSHRAKRNMVTKLSQALGIPKDTVAPIIEESFPEVDRVDLYRQTPDGPVLVESVNQPQNRVVGQYTDYMNREDMAASTTPVLDSIRREMSERLALSLNALVHTTADTQEMPDPEGSIVGRTSYDVSYRPQSEAERIAILQQQAATAAASQANQQNANQARPQMMGVYGRAIIDILRAETPYRQSLRNIQAEGRILRENESSVAPEASKAVEIPVVEQSNERKVRI